VAIGYDRPGQSIVLRSGPNRREALGALTFDHLWARSGRWGMLALPPGRLPATATAGSYLAAATALERVSPEAAASAYDTAVTAWPGHRLGWLGRGNARASAGDARGAERAFRQALARFPDDADAWNNLATTLAELGRTAQAREAVSRAIELGGPREARYRQTRAQLETAAGR
jgi:predicted Zn-dependent protease